MWGNYPLQGLNAKGCVMVLEYTLIDFKPSDFKDDYGNTWCDAAFKGMSEPVKWAVKDPSKPVVGQNYWGTIDEKTSKAGKTYLRFNKKQPPENTQTQDGKPNSGSHEDGVAWGNALNVAAISLSAKVDKQDLVDFATFIFDHRPSNIINVKPDKTSEEYDVPEDWS